MSEFVDFYRNNRFLSLCSLGIFPAATQIVYWFSRAVSTFLRKCRGSAGKAEVLAKNFFSEKNERLEFGKWRKFTGKEQFEEARRFGRKDFSHCTFEDVAFSDLPEGLDFSGSTLLDCSFQGQDLTNISFMNARLMDISFDNSNLESVSFEGAVMWGDSFVATSLSNVVFDGAELLASDKRGYVDFKLKKTKNVSFQKSILRHVKLASFVLGEFRGIEGIVNMREAQIFYVYSEGHPQTERLLKELTGKSFRKVEVRENKALIGSGNILLALTELQPLVKDEA